MRLSATHLGQRQAIQKTAVTKKGRSKAKAAGLTIEPPQELDKEWEKCSNQEEITRQYWYRELQKMIEIIQLRKRIYEEIR
jgi:hypothetical protein